MTDHKTGERIDLKLWDLLTLYERDMLFELYYHPKVQVVLRLSEEQIARLKSIVSDEG